MPSGVKKPKEEPLSLFDGPPEPLAYHSEQRSQYVSCKEPIQKRVVPVKNESQISHDGYGNMKGDELSFRRYVVSKDIREEMTRRVMEGIEGRQRLRAAKERGGNTFMDELRASAVVEPLMSTQREQFTHGRKLVVATSSATTTTLSEPSRFRERSTFLPAVNPITGQPREPGTTSAYETPGKAPRTSMNTLAKLNQSMTRPLGVQLL